MDFALGVLLFVTSLAADQPARDGSHVRTMDTRLRAEIDEGLARSSLFRDLVARLDASDVIVYVESECAMSPRLFARLTFMASGGGRRYVNVRVSCALTDSEQIAALGHELRHAVEIADAPPSSTTRRWRPNMRALDLRRMACGKVQVTKAARPSTQDSACGQSSTVTRNDSIAKVEVYSVRRVRSASYLNRPKRPPVPVPAPAPGHDHPSAGRRMLFRCRL